MLDLNCTKVISSFFKKNKKNNEFMCMCAISTETICKRQTMHCTHSGAVSPAGHSLQEAALRCLVSASCSVQAMEKSMSAI